MINGRRKSVGGKPSQKLDSKLETLAMHERSGVSVRSMRRQRAVDCDAHKRTYAAEMLASIVEHSNDAIFSRTIDGKVTSWNAAAERVFGYSEKEIAGRDSRILLPPHRPDELEHIL